MPPSADPTVLDVLDTLRRQSPDVPFLALGQTALWDEPTKAVWLRLLNQHSPDTTLIAGVHDTDYFAKTVAHIGDAQRYLALPHDDGRTRDLWSAAGELSALFGSESIPTRQMFRGRGVPFDWLAKSYPGGKDALYADKTTAWGWRGIVSTQSHSVIAHDIPVLDIRDALLAQLDWGFAESLACLDGVTRERAAHVTATIRGWVTEFLADCQADCRLSDLYRWLLPRFYALLLHAPPENLQTTASTELFQFNRQTCRRPRFLLLQAFLDPKTRADARASYDRAVGGSGIYTLDGFGPGAIPFDVVIPGHGRGTLRLIPRGIVIETTPTETMLGRAPVQTLEELAALLEDAFGPDVALVGKAVTLVDMLAAEYVVVFHETASGYTNLTQRFNQGLAAAGVPRTPLHPIVRLAYPTWDALGAVPAETAFQLPPHLARAFGQATISAPEFARQWRAVVETQRGVVRESQNLRRARDLMTFLDGKDDSCWCDRLTEYETAMAALKEVAEKSQTLARRVEEHRSELRLWQKERQGLEARMGADWRHSVEPIRAQIRDAEARGENTIGLLRDLQRQSALREKAFVEPLQVCRERITATKFLLAEFRRQRRLLERGPEARQARDRVAAIVRDAQLARLDLVRDAYLTMEGLEHTQLRPTAWWLPLVSPDGAWFDAMVAGTQARLESLE